MLICFRDIVENNKGIYEVWCEKDFCINNYTLYASQVGVKYKGLTYQVNNHMTEIVFYKVPPQLYPFSQVLTPPEIEKVTIHLQRFRNSFRGSIVGAKKFFQFFKESIENDV